MNKVRLSKVKQVHFKRTELELTSSNKQEMNSWWNDCVSMNLAIFNGPILANKSCYLEDGGILTVEYYLTNYCHYLIRKKTDRKMNAASAIYCSVAIVTRSGLVVGEMSDDTSAPGQLQLPGGNIEYDPEHNLDLHKVAMDSCRELEEEIGIKLSPSQLTLWRVKTGGEHDDLGFIFINNIEVSDNTILSSFDTKVSSLESNGLSAEFKKIHFVTSESKIAHSNQVDYLRDVLKELPPNDTLN